MSNCNVLECTEKAKYASESDAAHQQMARWRPHCMIRVKIHATNDLVVFF